MSCYGIELLGPFDDPLLLSLMYVICGILSVYSLQRLDVVKKFNAVEYLLKGQILVEDSYALYVIQMLSCAQAS